MSSDDELVLIRKHLLGADYDELLALRDAMDDPIQFGEKLSGVISEALAIRLGKDDSVAKALAPSIEGAINESISRNPKALADTLYPVMGPAIRKSISESLAQMLENINQVLEQGMSPRSIGWRIDAWRTGRSYSEIVLTNTIDYRVEQVFLIHGETSLLIQHVESQEAKSQDPDMVSGMLSAIQDFISDSFEVAEGESLQSMKLGDLTVVIEKGPHAILAVVVRGSIPEQLRKMFVETIEKIHETHGRSLAGFSGDTAPFVALEPMLEQCIQAKRLEEEKKKTPWLGIGSVLLVVILLAWFIYSDYSFSQARNAAVETLSREPGITITGYSSEGAAMKVKGLRDVLARDPEVVIGAQRSLELGLEYQLKPYISAEPAIMIARLVQVLEPPAGVQLNLDNDRLLVSGRATTQWFEQLQAGWRHVPGVSVLDTGSLDVFDPVQQEINKLVADINAQRLSFERAAVEPVENAQQITGLLVTLQRLFELAETRQLPLRLMIVGHTDDTGLESTNQRLATKRAESVANMLISGGVPEQKVIFSGAHKLVLEEDAPRVLDRVVTLEIIDPPQN